jgi:hypothetical protein
MKLRKFIATTIREYMNEQRIFGEYITLKELYGNEYPDDDELIWEFVSKFEFDKTKFKIIEIDVNEYFEKYVDEMTKISSEQKKIIKNYTKNINTILDTVIVVNSFEKLIIDGYHRLAAFHFSGIKKIKALDLSDET